MRPARMPSRWVKILPWYYTERNQPTRAADKAKALRAEDEFYEDDEPIEDVLKAWRDAQVCLVCALPGGGRGGPVYWLQRWHLRRVTRSMP